MAEYTENFNLIKPGQEEFYNVENFNNNADIIDAELKKLENNKVDKVEGKQLSTEDYTTEEKQKLAGIEEGANKYTHPKTHSANIITENENRRFVSDEEKANWNAKETPEGAQAKVDALAGEGNIKTVKQLDDDLAAHKADYAYQKAGGTATAITLTINNLKDGYPMTFIASANNNGVATTINGKRLYKPNTTDAPNLIKGKAYTVWYNSTSNCFFIKASAEGNASVENVLAGKTFSNDNDTGIIGTMPNKGKVIFTPSKEVQTGGKGYYSEIIVEAIPLDDTTNAPGNKFLIGGDLSAGYFGFVHASEFITGDALASLVGISAGTSQFSSEGWLKFVYNGKIQFVAKKPIRHGISWNDINAAGCVFGTKTVEIGGLTYKVRLMKTGLSDPMSSGSGAVLHGSEWNRLMLPIHVRAKDKNWNYPSNVKSNIPYWGIDFTDEDLLTHYDFGSGSYSWCQETYSSYRVSRGYNGVSHANSYSPGTTHFNMGWRPVLELVA